MKKTMIIRALFGIPMGIAISYIISIGISLAIGDGRLYPYAPALLNEYGTEINAIIVQTIGASVTGMIWAGASIIWEKDNWSLSKQTLIHFVIGCATFPIAYLMYWMQRSLKGFLTYLGIFLVIYLIIWISGYLAARRSIQQINNNIKRI